MSWCTKRITSPERGKGPAFISPVSTDGDLGKLSILNKVSYGNWKFIYVPFEFRLPGALRDKYEADMQQDDANAWRVDIEAYVREKEAGGYKPKETPDKRLQFIVKYNATTTLCDIARGGVWHWDPKLSGTDPKNLDLNPATPELIEGKPERKLRASITPGIYLIDPDTGDTAPDDRKALDPERVTWKGEHIDGAFSLKDARLDAIQLYLDKAARGLRQKKPLTQDLGYEADLQPEPSFERRTFFPWTPSLLAQAKADGISSIMAGDGLGGYGYRTVALVNALQQFTPEEARCGVPAGNDARGRNLNAMDTWTFDPAATSTDREPPKEEALKAYERLWRIMPALRQCLMDGDRFNPDAMYFHYLAAYPATRSAAAAKGATYPVSGLITRELVFGPSRQMKGRASTPAPSGLLGTLGEQRQKIDDLLDAIRQIKDPVGEKTEMAKLFSKLAGALEAQDIITTLSGKEKDFFNPGIGILQLALSKSWIRFPGESPDVARPRSLNENQLFITEPPDSWNYVKNKDFNRTYYDRILAFLTDEKRDGLVSGQQSPSRNWRAGRVDILINGVATGAGVLKDYMDHMQDGLTLREMESGAPWTKPGADGPKRSPFIVSYNVSRKLRQGTYGGPPKVINYFDINEMIGDWLTPLDPNHRIDQVDAMKHDDWRMFNPDAIRLIGILRAVVQALRSDKFKSLYYLDQLSPEFREAGSPDGAPIQVVDSNTGKQSSLLPNLYRNLKPNEDLTPGELQTLLPIQPVDYQPQDDPEGTALLAFRRKVRKEINRLEQKIDDYPIVLNAHSQGAAKSAVALRRLDTVEYIRGIPASSSGRPDVEVPDKIHFISYGGVAAMNEWGKGEKSWLKYRTFTHHINIWDPARLVGMGKPFGLFGQDHFRSDFAEFQTARQEQHHVLWHQRKDPKENQSKLFFWQNFPWHRFWTYDCQIPVTQKDPASPVGAELDLKDLPNLPEESKAEDTKEMCEKADQ